MYFSLTNIRHHRLVAGLFGALVSQTILAASFLGVDVPAPLPAKNVVDTYWGTPVDDPYRFLEDTKDPAVQAWMKSQANATEAILAKLPARAELRARLAEIETSVPASISAIYRTKSGAFITLRRNAQDNQFKLVRRETVDGEDLVLVDPEALAKTAGTAHAIGGISASPDGKLVAYSISTGGAEIGSLHVIDVRTGKSQMPPIDNIRGSGEVSWLDDSSGFFYHRLHSNWASLPRAERFLDTKYYFHRFAATSDDPAVFGPGLDPSLALPRAASGDVFAVPGTKLVYATVHDGVKRELSLYAADLDDALLGKARWRRLFGEEAKISRIGVAGGWLYARSALDAPRYKLLRMPVADADLAKAQTIIAAGEDVVVELAAAQDALYVTQRRGPVTRLLRVEHGKDAKPVEVRLPFAGHVDLRFAEHDQVGAIFSLGGWVQRAKFHAFDPVRATVTPLPLVPPGKFDAPPGLNAREVRIKSHDGVEVPASIISRADIKLDGRNPTILYGYGAYGTTEEPGWGPNLLAWLERGGVFVYAHVRGGGVYGDAWHRAGLKTTKSNTWKDGIAVAEWLIAQRYTAADRLAVYGGSAGGVFVGRAVTARPDLFAAGVVTVGNTDQVRSETRANGGANIPEYGTVKKEDEFRGLLEMSTYASVHDGTKYPAMLFEHGVNDIRVDVWMTLKTGSRMAAASSSGSPILLRLEYDGGHGVGATRSQTRERTADRWAFLLWRFGLTGP